VYAIDGPRMFNLLFGGGDVRVMSVSLCFDLGMEVGELSPRLKYPQTPPIQKQ
jgi:hypothetical protein